MIYGCELVVRLVDNTDWWLTQNINGCDSPARGFVSYAKVGLALP